MDLNLSWGDLARACGGALSRGGQDGRVGSISTDTRRLAPGQIFWALRGRSDGHEFLAAATASPGWVVERGRPLPATQPEHVLEVSDTLKALQALAAYHRRRFDIPVACITGSNGKTSTKEMFRSICARRGPVCATAGNLNNHIGLPLSVLELGPAHRYGVFELGASRPGEIQTLAQIAQPTVGVLTNIAPAHLEFFGSMENIFKTKCELIDALPPRAPIALNLDDPWLVSLESHLGSRAVTYGRSKRAAVRWSQDEDGSLALLISRRRIAVPLSVPGELHYWNAAAAAAGAVGLGFKPADIAEGLKAYQSPPMRFEVRRHAGGAVLISDAYNANPGSMQAGIASFCGAYPGARRILGLGDMKELGPESARFHRELGDWLAGQPIAAVFLAGPEMAATAEALAASKTAVEFRYHPDYQDWLPELRSRLKADAAVYLKASRAMAFERILELL